MNYKQIYRHKTSLSKLFLFLFLIPIFVTPLVGLAQTADAPFVPCDGVVKECGFAQLVELINRVLAFLIKISIPVATAVFAYAGFLYMTTGVADKRSEAKGMIQKTLIGFVIILSAWLVTKFLVDALVNPNFTSIINLG